MSMGNFIIRGYMAVTVSVLGSGSRGNATFVKTDSVRLLIDAGLSRREVAKRLETIGEDPDGIDAVFVTHEHNDHGAGLRTMLKELSIHAFMTPGTMRGLEPETFEMNGSTITTIAAGVPFRVGDAEITPFAVPHDANEPTAFSISCSGVRITQLTDVGHLSDSVAKHLLGANCLILESNHDLEMLRVGPYPWVLKQRLLGRYGHLSNTAVAKFIREQYDGSASHMVLAHLSEKNNHPEIARQEALRALRHRGLASRVTTTLQQEPTTPIRLC
jgi:phosphoribosyl 1,2-cyclic phosphodiesterase